MSRSSSSSSSSSTKPKIFRVDTQLNVYCGHNLPAIRRVASSRSSREGDELFGCPLWPDDVDQAFCHRSNEKQLIKKNEVLELKVSNLKMENALLQEENKNLKLQLLLSKPPFKSIALCVILVVLVVYKLS